MQKQLGLNLNNIYHFGVSLREIALSSNRYSCQRVVKLGYQITKEAVAYTQPTLLGQTPILVTPHKRTMEVC